MNPVYALDIETACAVKGCKHFGQAMCPEDHSLSPWHSRITVASIVGPDEANVYRDLDQLAIAIRSLKDQGAELVMHNGKFDALHLVQKGVVTLEDMLAMWQHDSQLAAFVWTVKITDEWLARYNEARPPSTRPGGKHQLKTLAPYFLGVDPYWEVDDKDNDEYVLKDTRYTLELHEHLDTNMDAEAKKFYKERLLPWTKMLLEAELRGLKLDVEGLLKYQAELRRREAELEAKLDAMWAEGHDVYRQLQVRAVNARYDAMKDTKAREPRRQVALARVASKVSYDSPTQMKWLLGEFYGYNLKSLEGDEGTGKEVLNRLADEGREDVKVYLEWRKTQKILTAFIPSLLELRDDNGYIHPIFNPCGTKTGRLSSERINVQQVPKELKRFFSAGDGFVLIGRDAKAIEAKLIGLYLQDPVFLDIVLTGKSFHDVNAKEFFNLNCDVSDVSKLHPAERRAAKTIGFSLIFGAGVNRVRVAMAQAGFPVSQSEAKRIHSRYKELYKDAFTASKEVVEFMEQGGVMMNLLGRPIRVENPEDCYMRATNLLVQSSASDYNLYQAYSCKEALKKQGIASEARIFVHDFLALSVAKKDAERALPIISEVLNSFTVDTDHGMMYLDYDGEGYSETWN